MRTLLRPRESVMAEKPRPWRLGDISRTFLGWGGIQQFFRWKAVPTDKGENLIRVRAIARVDDHVQSNTSQGSVGAEPVNPYVQNVDVLGREHSGQLM